MYGPPTLTTSQRNIIVTQINKQSNISRGECESVLILYTMTVRLVWLSPLAIG